GRMPENPRRIGERRDAFEPPRNQSFRVRRRHPVCKERLDFRRRTAPVSRYFRRPRAPLYSATTGQCRDPALQPHPVSLHRPRTNPTFAFVAAPSAEAQAALAELKSRYGEADPVHAEILVVLGGDGTMLETLHRHMGRQVRIFGMNCGTVGFLMNRYG